MSRTKTFTLDEARELLPELRDRLIAMQVNWQNLAPYQKEVRQLAMKIDKGGSTISDAGKYLSLAKKLKSQLTYFENMSIEVKDITSGLVDFPFIREGRIVYLCWKMSEETISHWHETDAGLAGRQPI
ncbi:MAG: DUF2203 domain-containing protein [Nitrospinaceae bacterium]|jgi:hypothetical protein|nr:DUF2203 domain-containing protein [Nitrospinaceae bacterium]MBT3433613.1 DUF2203 domain-containing protein [Nitrospinaceae bacterium]MBT3820295.1 DUF2203 domain-containing protein [Nitrospinaceae bacterium]MBT4093814.1 DUF2203 domain-containing protein [Nitrospinaceae bacterium]MBT4430015.1 DUF2203 domain-containing protein [Nitrospinaceae bacterium]